MVAKKKGPKGTSCFKRMMLLGLVCLAFCIGMWCQNQMSAGPDAIFVAETVTEPQRVTQPPVELPVEPPPEPSEPPPEATAARTPAAVAEVWSNRKAVARKRAFGEQIVKADGTTWLREAVGCRNCCNDGVRPGPCFDVQACALGAIGGRYALVYAHVGHPGWPWLTFLDSLWHQVQLLEAAQSTADIVVLMPKEDLQKLGCHHQRLVERYRLRLMEVPWTIPPNCWYPSYWWPGKADGWCGPQDLMRLHVLGMDDYDAVVFYDQDVEFQGDMTPVLHCAARGYFISASGGVGEPFNVGFFALKPSKQLLRAAELFGASVNFSAQRGWGECGFLPSTDKFVGAECGQGYFHTLFYKDCKAVRKALVAAGLHDANGKAKLPVQSVMIDRCIWNYQNDGDCGNPLFNCSIIQVHHKPTHRPENDRLCGKLKFHKGGWTGEVRPAFTAPSPPKVEQDSGACVKSCVDLGNNCICNRPQPPLHHIKNVSLQSHAVHCQELVKSQSNDVFSVKITGAKQLTVQRLDAESCWCDDITVECCLQ